MKKMIMTMKLPMLMKKKKNWWIASCPILDVITQGETEEKAKQNLNDALSLFLVSCFERGTLDSVLKECGFRPGRTGKKIADYPESKYIDVPIELLTTTGCCSNCHA
ncbi:MAG: type II toxin-antitoxin system HicB family antitoxin [Desulfatirhabdiaceae bacterium]